MDKPPVLNREQIRRVDRIAVDDYGIPSEVLMENAGRGIADRISGLGIEGPVAILCGKGNNGGDGFVLARHLDLRGYDVCCILAAPRSTLRGDAALNFRIVDRLGILVISSRDAPTIEKTISESEWIVDGLLGTGATGPPRDQVKTLIELANQASGCRFAIDIPSGLDCDTGMAAGAVFRADHTGTLAALKKGLVADCAKTYVGTLCLLDIGIPQRVIDRAVE